MECPAVPLVVSTEKELSEAASQYPSAQGQGSSRPRAASIDRRGWPGALRAQHVCITDATRVANAIEELQYLDRALAPETHQVAEVRRVHCTMLAMTGTEDRRELRYRLTIVVEIAYHLVHLALTDELAQHGAHSPFVLVDRCGQIAHPGRIE